jgi:hypothetical protein
MGVRVTFSADEKDTGQTVSTVHEFHPENQDELNQMVAHVLVTLTTTGFIKFKAPGT